MSDIRIKLALDGASAVVSGIERVKASLGGMSTTVAGLAGTLGVAAFGSLIKGAINAADALDEMSQRYGVSAKELSALQLAFKQAGMAPEAMAKSLGKLSLEIAKGGDGLAAIGVKARNADGTLRSTTAVLADVADKFQGMQDGAGKTALALEIFGKSGAEMVPLLNGGSEGIAEMTAMAERLGLVISDDVAARAGAFNDTLELLGLGVQGVASQVSAQLLPTLTGLAGQFLQSMTSGDRLKKTADFLATGLKGLYVVGLGVVEIFTTVGTTLGGVSAAVVAALSGDFAGAANILRDMKSDIGAGWKATLGEMQSAWNATGNASVEAMAKTMGAAKAAAPDVARVGKTAKAVKDEFADLLNKLTAKDAGLDPSFYKDLDTLHQGYLQGRVGVDAYREAVELLIGSQQFAKDAAKDQQQAILDAAAANNKAFDEFEAADEKQRKAVEDRIKAGRTMLEALEQEIAFQGMSNEQREVATSMLELERQGVVKGTEAYAAYATRIADAVQIKAANAEHLKMWESIDKTAHDVFVNVFEDGAGTFKRLGKTLKASLLDWLYQMTIKKWIVNVSGQFTGSAQGGAGSGGGGGSMLDLNSVMGAGLQAYGGFTAGASAASLGYANVVGAAGGDALGALIAGNGGWAGVGAGGAAGGTGIMSSIGAAAPWLLGGLALVSLLSGLDDSGTYHTGGAGSAGPNGLRSGVTAESLGFKKTQVSTETTQTMEQTAGTVAAMFNSLGKGSFNVSTAFADDTSKDGAWGALRIERNGQKLLDWNDTRTSEWAPKEFGDGATGVKEYEAALAASVRDALEQVGLPGWATSMLDALGDAPTFEQISGVMQSVTVMDQTLLALGAGMTSFASMSDEAVTALVEASGGVANLSSSLGYFYQNFFTESERLAFAAAQTSDAFSDLGMAMPTSRDQFKEMLNAAIAAGDNDLAAKLLALAPAVASVIAPVEDLTEAARSAADIANERAGLERELLQLQGNTAALRAMDLAELDASNQALQRQIWALEDQQAAAEEAARAAEAAAQAHAQYVQALANAGGTITQLIRDLTATEIAGATDPVALMRQRQADYLVDLSAARAGDVAASQRVAQSARSYLDAAGTVSSDARQAATVAQVVSELKALPAVATYEQQMLSELQAITAAVNLSGQAVVSGLQTQTTTLAGRISADFDRIDANLDGKLTLAELQSANLASDAQLQAIFTELDTNGDGVLDKLEAIRSTVHTRVGELISFGGVVTFNPNDPLMSIFTNISQTNNILAEQFRKWLEYMGGLVVSYDKAAGTLTTSALYGFETATNRVGGAAGFPGQYQLAYDSTNYLEQIRDTLLGVAQGSLSWKVRGWAANQALPVVGLGGYAEGGYTGAGGKYEAAGIVHRGEVVWSQADIARWGGVGVVDAMRRGMKGYADGGVAGLPMPWPVEPPQARRDDGTQRLLRALVDETAELRRQVASLKAAAVSTAANTALTAASTRAIEVNGVAVHTEGDDVVATREVVA